jgi:cytochrome c553
MLKKTHLVCLVLFGILGSAEMLLAADQPKSGEQIYQEQCARCHGMQGEGVKEEYSQPLQRRHSLDELRKIIDETMPADHPEACVGEDANRVAQFVFDTIYVRNDSLRPRVELSRLTVRQYANSVTDLLGGFLGQQRPDDKRGLQARYFKEHGFGGDKLALERTDARVEFDFADKSPDPEKIGSEEFAIRWQGGVIAEETGEYEFIVRTENGTRLWINDPEKPLVDASVRSGDEKDHRGSIRLVAGRAYHLRLEYFKFKDKTASVALEWQTPRRARQTIPERNLSPGRFPYCFVLQSPFPPDDSSMGYERGTAVSAEWNAAQAKAALEVARFVVSSADRLAGTKEDAPDRAARWKDFCYRFAERAFRRPLDAEQRTACVDRHWEGKDPQTALRNTILVTLMSPQFLYPDLGSAECDDFTVAARLALALWDSLPDDSLREAAAKGQLRNEEQVSAQVRRMLNDPRTKTKVRSFFHKWLPMERLADISRDKERFPGFDPLVVSDLRTSLDLFLDDVAWGEHSDFRQLLLADDLFLNDRLSKFYASEPINGPAFQKVKVSSVQRAGILTHPCLMTGLAYYNASSPIHRGVFLARSVLGRTLKAPPIAVSPIDEGVNPDMTTRERVSSQTSPAACQSCHGMINALGFTLESYDAVGRFRELEKGRKVDATGSYRTLAGEETRFENARQLAEYLAKSPEVHRAFVQQLFQYMVAQPVNAYGSDRLSQFTDRFTQSRFQIPPLLVDILTVSALHKHSKENAP